jgi:hypothetical protein
LAPIHRRIIASLSLGSDRASVDCVELNTDQCLSDIGLLDRVSGLDDAYMYSLLLPLAALANHSTEKDAEEDAPPLPEPVTGQLREQLVPAMVALSSPNDRPVRAQIAEAVSIVATMDFPEQWPDLIDVSAFSITFHHTDIREHSAFGTMSIS